MGLTISANPNTYTTQITNTAQVKSYEASNPVSENKPAEEEERQPEARGEKSEVFRKELINKYKDLYDIKRGTEYSYSLDKDVPVYYITAKSEVKLHKLKSDLGIKNGIIAACNGDAYSQYGSANNGHYIEDTQMKGRTIHIPVSALGEIIDERGFLDKLIDFFKYF